MTTPSLRNSVASSTRLIRGNCSFQLFQANKNPSAAEIIRTVVCLSDLHTFTYTPVAVRTCRCLELAIEIFATFFLCPFFHEIALMHVSVECVSPHKSTSPLRRRKTSHFDTVEKVYTTIPLIFFPA